MSFITFLITLYMGIVMVGFRIHYTVDIIMGMVMGHYCFIFFEGSLSEKFDYFFKSLFGYFWFKLDRANSESEYKINSNN